MAITTAQRACILAKGGAPRLQSLAPARPQPRAWILRRAFKPAVQPGAAAGRVRCYSTSEEKPYTITTPLYYVNAGGRRAWRHARDCGRQSARAEQSG